MKQVRNITCINNADFVQKFKVIWNGGQTGWSDTYPNPQSFYFWFSGSIFMEHAGY